MGQIYVPVTANAINGDAMSLESSGQTSGSYWIQWDIFGGYQGKGWFWDTPNNYLKKGWEDAVAAGGGYVNGCPGENDGPHNFSQESFEYHITNGHSEDLNLILGP